MAEYENQEQVRPRVVVADSDHATLEWLQGALGSEFDSILVDHAEHALQWLSHTPTQLLIVGNRLDDSSGTELLRRVAERDPGTGPGAIMAIADTSGRAPESSDDAPLFYVLNRSLPAADVRALAHRAIVPELRAQTLETPSPRSRNEAIQMQQVLEVSRRLAVQRNLPGAAEVVTEAVKQFVGADRAYCLFYDSESGALWSERAETQHDDDGSATLGIAGFSARTGQTAVAEHAGRDPRYVKAIDDPAGDGHERLTAQPVAGPDGQIHAVLVAIRSSRKPAYSEPELALLVMLAVQAGPLLHQLSLQVEADAVIQEANEGAIFRQEALEQHMSRRQEGDVVRVSPHWLRYAYWLVLLFLVAGGGYMAIGHLDQYSEGMAIIRMKGRRELTTPVAGIISDIRVRARQRVSKGELLVSFYDAEEMAEYERIDLEYEQAIIALLRAPGDEAARQRVATLGGQRRRAEKRIEQRAIRAPHDGVVSEVSVRPGQHVVPGNVILAVIAEDAELEVVALLPGGHRPQLHPGMPMRLEMQGYRYAYQELTIASVSDVVGPATARQRLPASLQDAVEVGGPIVFVRAELDSREFESDGKTYRYHDGMPGRAEVRVGSESILKTLIPGLKKY